MSKVIHFEILADEPERAVEFYKEVFGWKIDHWKGGPEYWLVYAGEEDEPGINGAIMRRPNKDSVYIIINVPSIDEYLKKIVDAGGEIISPKQEIPNIGYSAYFRDTEGNVIGLFEELGR